MRTKAAWIVAGGAALAVVVIVACSGSSSTPAACNAGETRQCVAAGACAGGQVCVAGGAWSACDCGAGVDAGTDTGAPGDGGTDGVAPGPDITPYLKNCPQVDGGAPMINIGGATGFCIDTREATADEVNSVFAETLVSPDCPTTTPTTCQAKDRAVGAMPANCITWCRAAGRCAALGKRLCSSQEMRAACVDPSDFPWGQDVDASTSACFDLPIPPAGQSKCHSPLAPQYFADNVLGGIAEWLFTPKDYTRFSSASPVCGAQSNAPSTLLELPFVGYRCCTAAK